MEYLVLLAILFVFLGYGVHMGYPLRKMLAFALEGIKTIKNILLTFVLIGMLTALWRKAGTIAMIVCTTAGWIHPSAYLLMIFLLNAMMSVLTGTSFGTAATMGVICSTIGNTLGISPLLTGGAILSGVYFGDRCSPVSTSALLVATLTETSIYDNLKHMIRSAGVPFLLTCLIYGGVGVWQNGQGQIPDLHAMFAAEFHLTVLTVIPALVLVILAICKVDVKWTMLGSILAAAVVCVLVQKVAPSEFPKLLIGGFRAEHTEAALLNGGGILSMVKVSLIVGISSSYAGIFQNTGMLQGLEQKILALAERTGTYATILLTAVISGVVACNQTLTIMLTDQLTGHLPVEKEKFALDLEDSAVVVSPLIPWSIAGAVPLTTIGAPKLSVVFACFLYCLPVWRMISERRKKHSRKLAKQSMK